MNAQAAQRDVTEEQEVAVIPWLQENIIPIRHIEAGNGFADLQPLKQILSDAKVVGLGEATHGTREFFQLKHRLVEFLVTEMQFTIFTIEASYSACQPINDYILYGKGDRASVLTGQWYVVWDTEEIGSLIDWMRTYNQSVPNEKKVKFYGVDITRNEIGRQAVLNYLRKVDPSQSAATEALFEALAREEAKWPRKIDQETEKTLEEIMPRLQDLMDHLVANREALIERSSSIEFDQILHYTQVMKQWIIGNTTNLLPLSQTKSQVRSLGMAENLVYLADHAAPEAKFIIWEHNAHIAIDDAEKRNLGYTLRKKYGNRYFGFGFEFNQGAFQTRLVLPPNISADLKEVTLPPSPKGSLSWYLSRAGTDVFIVKLHTPPGDPVVKLWLDNPQITHNVPWVYNETLAYYEECPITKRYDGLVFVNRTTASRPNANALKTVANRDGL